MTGPCEALCISTLVTTFCHRKRNNKHTTFLSWPQLIWLLLNHGTFCGMGREGGRCPEYRWALLLEHTTHWWVWYSNAANKLHVLVSGLTERLDRQYGKINCTNLMGIMLDRQIITSSRVVYHGYKSTLPALSLYEKNNLRADNWCFIDNSLFWP